ncbi:hypothetical protein [Paraburkholderia unamae]|uniref:Uncharacterized protein n=1 Tax=Paraburkholderia unamae TaxID=219649 RepID=A0ACC6RGM3_9BURK
MLGAAVSRTYHDRFSHGLFVGNALVKPTISKQQRITIEEFVVEFLTKHGPSTLKQMKPACKAAGISASGLRSRLTFMSADRSIKREIISSYRGRPLYTYALPVQTIRADKPVGVFNARKQLLQWQEAASNAYGRKLTYVDRLERQQVEGYYDAEHGDGIDVEARDPGREDDAHQTRDQEIAGAAIHVAASWMAGPLRATSRIESGVST